MAEQPPSLNLHQAVGGTEAWRRLSTAFYTCVDRDPRLRHLFPGKTLHCAIEELTAFLVQIFGGPSADSQRRWWLSLRESHRRFKISEQERVAWMENMRNALNDAGIAESLRAALLEFFEGASAHVVNTGEAVKGSPDPEGEPPDAVRREMARRWQSQLELEKAVAALRAGHVERAITLAESSLLRTRLQADQTVLVGLLGMMMSTRNAAALSYVQQKVNQNPALVREHYAGRTLLHEASAQGNLAMVELFLSLGSDPDEKTAGGHTPLYCLANQYGGSDGGAVVHSLVQRGANVNASDGVKHCTPLHMAARRGSVAIAKALLDCGAHIEARDSLGETPLRRAVNCGKLQVADLLLERAADVHASSKKGLTPLQAARTAAMKQLLQSRVQASKH